MRELENVIKSSLLAADDVISGEHLPEYLSRASFPPAVMEAASGLSSDSIRKQIDEGLEKGLLDLKTLVARYSEEIEEQVLSELLHKRNFTQAELSALLQVDPKTLRAKLQKFGLKTR